MDNLGSFLEEKYNLYNRLEFIKDDPIQVPHYFTRKEDIEISAFLTATISWGQRQTIIRNAWRLMEILRYSPYDSLLDDNNLNSEMVSGFVHRTFNAQDAFYFLKSLRNIYLNHGGLEKVFTDGYQKTGTVYGALIHFRKIFFELPYPEHCQRHLANVEKGATAKRLNMFLKWMVRSDGIGVDFGLWKKIPASSLMLPLDVHTGNVSRALDLLIRKSNDWKAVEEITAKLRVFDPDDPIRFDYALFGLGAVEHWV
ncbi:MAG: TIGR02757 family protein [Bacteroidota bacterium]|nr:TIGR02757 family protein [Bacteroidota bacterium]